MVFWIKYRVQEILKGREFLGVSYKEKGPWNFIFAWV
jgi:hypothetical protein